MLEIADIERITRAGESATVELKRSTGQRSRAARTACGMLNQQGGTIVFGVDPNSRAILGQEVAESTLEQLAAQLRKITPFVSLSPEVIEVGPGRHVLALSVPALQEGPFTVEGRAYLRDGSETIQMPQEQYERLLYERMQPTRRWEIQPAHEISWEDLDASEVTRTIDEAIRRGRLAEPGTRNTLELLQKLKVVTEDGTVLNAAVALFGREDNFLPHFPQCLLRLAKFRGLTMSEFVDNRQVRANVFALLRRAERFAREHLPIAGRIVPDLFTRVDDPLYPPEALREAVANALCHRDYAQGGGSVGLAIFDDRLEVVSSGRLRFGQTVDSLTRAHTSRPWNPIIANVLYLTGVIEQWGRGTLKIVELTERAELRPATFLADEISVTVRFHASRNVTLRRLGRSEQRVYQFLRERAAALSLGEITAEVNEGIAARTVQKALAELRDLGYVELRGRGRGARWLATPTPE